MTYVRNVRLIQAQIDLEKYYPNGYRSKNSN